MTRNTCRPDPATRPPPNPAPPSNSSTIRVDDLVVGPNMVRAWLQEIKDLKQALKDQATCSLCKRYGEYGSDPTDIVFRVCRSHEAVGMWND